MAVGAGAIASGMTLLPSALKPKMAWWIWLMDGLGAVPCRNGQNCAPQDPCQVKCMQREQHAQQIAHTDRAAAGTLPYNGFMHIQFCRRWI